MFERYVTDVLTTHFGHLIEGFDKDRIRLSAWSGELVMKDLSLRRNALDHWITDCPIDMCYGRIGNLEIRIPWKFIRSKLRWRTNEPSTPQLSQNDDLKCTVILSDVQILVTPRKEVRTTDSDENETTDMQGASPEEEQRKLEEAVEAALEKHLLKRAASVSSPAAKESPVAIWIHERLAEILANLVITVRNVHVRYEDPGDCLGFARNVSTNQPPRRYRPPFSIGVLLQEFTVHSASKDSSSSTRDRIVSVHDIAAYWDSRCVLASDLKNRTVRGLATSTDTFYREAFLLLDEGALPASFMSDSEQSTFQSRHTYFLDPFSPSIQLALSPSTADSTSMNNDSMSHSSSIDVYFPACQIIISRSLLEDIGYLRKSFAVWTDFKQNKSIELTLEILSKLRPTQSPLIRPRQWWLYAFEAITALQSRGKDYRTSAIMRRRRRGWLGVAQILGKRGNYTALYQNIFLEEDQEVQRGYHIELVRLEAQLTVAEIVAFRLHAYETLRGRSGEAPRISFSKSISEFPRLREDTSSLQHRKSAFAEMAEFLDNASEARDIPSSVSAELNPVCVLFQCPEFAFRFDDQKSRCRKREPVARLSCAFMQKQEIFHDGSWNTTNIIGDLVVKDCTSVASHDQRHAFPHLVCSRACSNDSNDDGFKIDNKFFKEIMSVRIRRVLEKGKSSEFASITSTVVRMRALEIVYVTKPVEALSRICRAVNADFNNDYHQMVARLKSWKEEQQRRLLITLAHKENNFLVDLDLKGPVFLFPESHVDSSLMVAIDLGQLKFTTINETSASNRSKNFDDSWKLALTHIQVLRCSVNKYREISRVTSVKATVRDGHSIRSLIEPFSVTFSIETKIGKGIADETQVRIMATLPRLAFNLTSSTIRLLRSLGQQWNDRREEVRPRWTKGDLLKSPNCATRSKVDLPSTNRKITFQFQAPLFQLNVEDDIGHQLESAQATLTPLFYLTLRGIRCLVVSAISPVGPLLTSTVSLHRLAVRDLYQKAGDDFSFLISSVDPVLFQMDPLEATQSGPLSDLVSIHYVFEASHGSQGTHETPNRLSIDFHELFIEWNPESIGTIHKAMQSHSTDNNLRELEPFSSLYFDANEDDFFDAESVVSSSSGETFVISEISDSLVSSFVDLKTATEMETYRLKSLPFLGSPFGLHLQRQHDESVECAFAPQVDASRDVVIAPVEESTPLLVTFEMKKLKINFNKETRHRRVFTGEMGLCRVSFQSTQRGGYYVTAAIGNLILTDPGSTDNRTLYRELLGVKANSDSQQPASLLELKFVKNPRSRKYRSAMKKREAVIEDDCVSVDLSSGKLYGFDSKIEANLSPMKFVYIQQLWLEIVDYCFDGIVGFEVWGGTKPLPLDLSQLEEEASDAVERFGVNAFAIFVESPTILIPVSYCSTDFIRIECEELSIRNHFQSGPMRYAENHSVTGEPLLQWYNNVFISLKEIRLSDANGNIICDEHEAPGGVVRINWPAGRTAAVNRPKWEVKCSFDDLSLILRKEDFALLQHVLSLNIGEDSRNMDEWAALQSLPASVLQSYLASILVTFGYDQKDLSPTTFDATIAIPRVQISTRNDSDESAVYNFSELVWSFTKNANRMSKQLVHCTIQVVGEASAGSRKLIDGRNHCSAKITYSSISTRNGDNTRTVVVDNPLIQLAIPGFVKLSQFFRSLPQPTFLSPNEVIQVGDRWYPIGGISPRRNEPEAEERKMTWLPVTAEPVRSSDTNNPPLPSVYTFGITLRESQFILGNDDAAATLLVDHIDFTHISKDGTIRRKYLVDKVQMGLARNGDLQNASLIEPWSFTATTTRCNGQKQCSCHMHSDKVSMGKLSARLTYTSMLIGMDVALHIKRDITGYNNSVSGSESLVSVEENKKSLCENPPLDRFLLVSEGLRVIIVDDSGRHFSGSQVLFELSSDMIDFRTEERVQRINAIADNSISGYSIEKSLHLRVRRLDVFDCLQGRKSPFRHVLGLRPLSAAVNYEEAQTTDSGKSDQDLALEILSLVNEAHVYSIILGTVDIQYNPSMVIALQRFLGRLRKRFKERLLPEGEKGNGNARHEASSERSGFTAKTSHGTFECNRISICLNKEHQKRRLIRSLLSRCYLDLLKDKDGSHLQGRVEDLQSFVLDACLIGAPERNFINTCHDKDRNFLSVVYRTYNTGRVTEDDKTVPDWLQVYLISDTGTIDDYVDISVSSIGIRIVRNHIEELVDYLGNGMPGKGWGATTRAAKGFVKQRIEKRSYFRLDMESPKFTLPINEGTTEGVELKLGDVLLESWVNGSSQNDGSRSLKTYIKGIECTTVVANTTILKKVDLETLAETGSSCLSLNAQVSDVQLLLSYYDYIVLLKVFRSNLLRAVEKKDWDNLEAQWEKEQVHQEEDDFASSVAYASSARYVQFGGSKRSETRLQSTPSALRLSLGGLSITLSRACASPSHRSRCDFLFLQARGLELSANKGFECEMSCSLSLDQIYLFDLGGKRLESNFSSPRKASVIIEGYSPTEKHNDVADHSVSHLAFKVDKAVSGETKAAVVLSYLSVAVLQNFLQETTEFLTCRWPGPDGCKLDLRRDPNKSNKENDRQSPGGLTQIRFVLHYPRFIFVADESDPKSKALVLRGLAIANGGFRTDVPDADDEETNGRLTRINADLQNISSYIHADVSDILTPRVQHFQLIGTKFARDAYPDSPTYTSQSDEAEDFGIPLLLPLTVGMELEHFHCPRYGVKQSISINVDPLSVVVGSEDVNLIKSVVKNWSRSSKAIRPDDLFETYDVIFDTDKLGVGLKKEDGLVIVDSVKQAAESKGVRVGDVIRRINGEFTEFYNNGNFLDFVQRLSSLERPVTLTLTRRKAELQENVVQQIDFGRDRTSSFDVTFSSAILSLVERDFPLLKAEVLSSRLTCKMDEKEEKCIRLSISASVGVDYYNFRIWSWEPLAEQGKMLFSADFQDDRENTRQLTLEFSDSDDGLAFNTTSAAAEAISKFLSWSAYPLQLSQSVEAEAMLDEALSPDYGKDLTRNVRSAATAALVYARKQKHGSTRPFVFKNRTGLSAAFVQQKHFVKTEQPGLTGAPFLSVGEYSGLERYDPSLISVVGNGQDIRFRVDTNDGLDEGYSSLAKVPIVCVALQTVAGLVIEPLMGQTIDGPGEKLLPIRFHKTGDHKSLSSIYPKEGNQMLSWCVEIVDEKTIITLGSSIRIFSLLRDPIEVGLSFLTSDLPRKGQLDIKPVGTAYPKSYFFLPVWLDMTIGDWACSIRTAEEYNFTTLFYSYSKRGIDFGPFSEKTIECTLKRSASPSSWICAATGERDNILTVTLDSSLSLRNLLPVDIEWEVSDQKFTPTDGSTIRGQEHLEKAIPLKCGERVEIFTRSTEDITARFRPHGFAHWSDYVCVSFDDQKDEDSTQRPASSKVLNSSERLTVRYARLKDVFGIPHDLSVRILKKDCGLDVTIFAELWLTNGTTLDISFGYPWEPTSNRDNEAKPELVEDDFSAAEAALREISSLFEGSGENSKVKTTSSLVAAEITRISGQSVPTVVEEFFEYIDQENGNQRKWWALENSMNTVQDPRRIEPCNNDGKWFWKDKEWQIDYGGSLSEDGFESCSNLNGFSGIRMFDASHRFRRRRWYRRRSGDCTEANASGVHGYYQPRRDAKSNTKEEKLSISTARIGIQVNGGRWAISSDIPNISGRIYGAIRARAARWPELTLTEKHLSPASSLTSVFELCYTISPLEGAWGELSRSLIVTSRFLLINNSKSITFEVKQMGSSDSSSVKISPGEALPFHWTDCRRPELLSVRPNDLIDGEHRYKWSGGFDPLTIGALPIRIQEKKGLNLTTPKRPNFVTSVKMDSEIRRGTGGTGINLSFEEEENSGDGALFRVENNSTFPIWIGQDGVLANPSGEIADLSSLEGTMVSPASTSCFALDVPFRQGKYSGRKAATIAELLRVRLGLFPLNSRTGIETTKVLSLSTIGTRVRLNPSKLMFLHASLRSDLDRVRIFGVVTTDGPTTVLNLSIIEKDSDNFLVNPFSIDESNFDDDLDPKMSTISQLIAHAASETVIARCKERLPTELEVISRKLYRTTNTSTATSKLTTKQDRDLQISLRVSLRGLVVSFVDSAPSEIAVLTLRNLNAIASWNIHRTTNAAVIITVTDLQVDNMISNAPFPVAVSPIRDNASQGGAYLLDPQSPESERPIPPVLVIGLSFAPKHKTGTVCLRSVTIAPRDLDLRIDLAFLVRLQKFALEIESHFHNHCEISDTKWTVPDISSKVKGLETQAQSGTGLRKFFFSGFTILPHNLKLSVAPARALTGPQAALEGKENAALHIAVRKGDVRLDRNSAALLGVRVGRTNRTAVAVLRGVFKSIVVDALLRLDGASINFGGVSLRNHIATGSQLSSQLGAHYLTSLRQNVPALLGSLAAIGNPIGLARGLGDGVRDLILEPVKGFKRSVQEMDASYLVDGVARGTLSLARHTVGGFADSAAMLTETFSKNMAVLTLDRRYAQKRDRGEILRDHDDINVALGLGSGVQKLITGFLEGVTGVVKAPIRGAEKKGLEGFAKGIGKGLLGLLVKPIIGLSDGIADVMLGVKGSVEGATGVQNQLTQLRPRRALYGRERSLRPYNMADAAASALLMRTRLAGEEYFDHLDMGDRLVLISVKRLLILGSRGQELLLIRLKHIESLEVRNTNHGDDAANWSILILLNTPRSNGSDVEVIACKSEEDARELCDFLEKILKRLGTSL